MIPTLQPVVDNTTPFAVALLAVADERGRPVLAVVVKATFELTPGRPPTLAAEQQPFDMAGRYYGEPANSSLQFEPESAWVKPATDVVLLGHARAPDGPVTQLDVGLRVGPLHKVARVFGDRVWAVTRGSCVVSRPLPFERMPLVWERAFGGRDPDAPDTAFEPRNPVGRGFVGRGRPLNEPRFMPNIEDPNALLRAPGDAPAPVGFGFVAPHWQPRAALAGTYDAAWQAERAPALPADFRPAFLNAASPGLVAPGYLRGDEPVLVINAGPVPQLAFSLPGLRPPQLQVDWRRRSPPEALLPALDTVVIDTDAMQLLLWWRAHVVLPNRGIHAVAAIRVRSAL